MEASDVTADEQPASEPSDSEATVQLRLYVARNTPNSVRAQQNLASVLDGLTMSAPGPALEIIDVFTQPRRAMTDGVVVTPTLIGVRPGRRVSLMGDLADRSQLKRVLQDLLG